MHTKCPPSLLPAQDDFVEEGDSLEEDDSVEEDRRFTFKPHDAVEDPEDLQLGSF